MAKAEYIDGSNTPTPHARQYTALACGEMAASGPGAWFHRPPMQVHDQWQQWHQEEPAVAGPWQPGALHEHQPQPQCFKTTLRKWLQANRPALIPDGDAPEGLQYQTVEVEGQGFQSTLAIPAGGSSFTGGVFPRQVEAEQDAARSALRGQLGWHQQQKRRRQQQHQHPRPEHPTPRPAQQQFPGHAQPATVSGAPPPPRPAARATECGAAAALEAAGAPGGALEGAGPAVEVCWDMPGAAARNWKNVVQEWVQKRLPHLTASGQLSAQLRYDTRMVGEQQFQSVLRLPGDERLFESGVCSRKVDAEQQAAWIVCAFLDLAPPPPPPGPTPRAPPPARPAPPPAPPGRLKQRLMEQKLQELKQEMVRQQHLRPPKPQPPPGPEPPVPTYAQQQLLQRKLQEQLRRVAPGPPHARPPPPAPPPSVSWKNALQEWVQVHLPPGHLPQQLQYCTVPAPAGFQSTVSLKTGEQFTGGVFPRKVQAEQDAARAAWVQLTAPH